jgi:hypothetical protein
VVCGLRHLAANSPFKRGVSMTEPGWTEVKRLSGDDPHRYVAVLRGPHGLYRFDALRWSKYYTPSEEDNGPIVGGLWAAEHQSGLFGSPEEAERNARLEVAWVAR